MMADIQDLIFFNNIYCNAILFIFEKGGIYKYSESNLQYLRLLFLHLYQSKREKKESNINVNVWYYLGSVYVYRSLRGR
jgi:hypothetical protein